MKKRFPAMFLALVMCLALTAPAAASLTFDPAGTEERIGDFLVKVYDEGGATLKKYYGDGGAVTIPDGVTIITESVFRGCTGLTSVTLPDGVTIIGNSAFQDCTNLTSVRLPNSLTTIGTRAFYFCENLTNVEIPDGVTEIGNEAFTDTGLTNLVLPSGMTEVPFASFSYCANLTSVTIPDGYTFIGRSAFLNCEKLTNVTIPDSVTEIGDLAFAGCDALTDAYYSGSEAQWREHRLGMYPNTTIHFNSTGPSATDQPTTPTTPATPSSNLPTVEAIPAAGTAVASTQTVKLDGKDVQFQYYAVKDAKGNESNYVKIRDLANALNGTKAQFNVGWDGKISITSNTAYQVAGGEGTTPYSGSQPYTAVSSTPVSFNGSPVNLTSFQLKDSAGNGYTYYKLRDLGQLLNFNVKWDNGVVIETDKPYTG